MIQFRDTDFLKSVIFYRPGYIVLRSYHFLRVMWAEMTAFLLPNSRHESRDATTAENPTKLRILEKVTEGVPEPILLLRPEGRR